MLTRIAITLGAALTLALSGCSSTPAPPPSDFGPVREAPGAVSLTETRPLLVATSGEASRRFTIVAGDEEGRTRILQIRAHDDQNIIQRTMLDGDDNPLSLQNFAVAADGNLVSWRDVNYAHEVFTEFKPPMVIFPKELAPARPVTQSLEFIVHPLAERQKVKQRGRAEVTISLVGLQTVQLADGSADAIHVQTKLTVDFGAANVERTTDEWFLPGVGLIADSFDEQIKVLGVTTEHTTQTAVAESVSPSGVATK
jgi:hypothetical protein